MFFYCESEQGSTCSTPFVSAPSSPTRTLNPTSASSSSTPPPPKSNSLYYYFSAPSSPPKQPMSGSHHRGFSFTECEFQFHSRFISDPPVTDASPKEQQEMEDAQLAGFYFSAPTSPDRNKERLKGGISAWDEMPGTPKIIFGGGSGMNPPVAGGFFNADSDFEFSSSRMSDSDSTISAHMSSADELFFKGQLLPMKLRDHQLTSSDSSGSSNMGGASSSSVAGSAPQSPRFGRKGGDVSPNRMKSAVMGTICGAVLKSSEDEKLSGGNSRTRSPLQLLRKYQSMMMMMGRPSSNSSSSSSLASSSKSKSSHMPRPARSSSKGRTLRELLHLSSVHKKSKAEPPPVNPNPDQDVSKPISDSDTTNPQATEGAIPSKSVDTISSSGLHPKKPNSQQQQQQQQQAENKKSVERSLLGDYTKRFNKHQQHQQATRRRYNSGSLLDLHYGYYNTGKHRLHSGSIVPESDYPPPAPPPHHHLMNKLNSDKRLNYHAAPDHNSSSRTRAHLGSAGFHSGPLGGGEFNHISLGGSSHSNRFANVAAVATTLDHHHQGSHSRRWESGVYSYYNNSNSNSMGSNGVSSASSSRNVSPRRGRHSSGGGGGGGIGHSGSVSLHELHYKSQRGNTEELRRKTFLPYKQGLLGCLGCATMRIAGLSKSLQPMASSR